MELIPSGAVAAWLYDAGGTRYEYGAHTVSVPWDWTPDFTVEGLRGTGYVVNLYAGVEVVAT